MPLKILLFGKPGAGKDTQAKMLCEKFGIEHLSGGDLLRQEIVNKTELGLQVAQYVARGEFVPKGIVGALMQARILDPCVQVPGYVTTGYPRSQESFEKYLTYDSPTLVIVLNVSDEEITKRLLSRKREDDNVDAIVKRLAAFSENDEKLFSWLRLRQDILVHEIDGTPSPEEVFRAIEKIIERI